MGSKRKYFVLIMILLMATVISVSYSRYAEWYDEHNCGSWTFDGWRLGGMMIGVIKVAGYHPAINGQIGVHFPDGSVFYSGNFSYSPDTHQALISMNKVAYQILMKPKTHLVIAIAANSNTGERFAENVSVILPVAPNPRVAVMTVNGTTELTLGEYQPLILDTDSPHFIVSLEMYGKMHC